MPIIPEPYLKILEALSYLMTILSAPLIAASVMAAFGQIKSQTKTARYQVSLQALLSFSDQYQKISTYRNSLREQFDNGDKTVNERSILTYFNMFWINALNQWSFLEKGLIPKDTFISWTVFAYGLMSDRVIFHYFDTDGTAQPYPCRRFFEERFITGAYKNDRSFYDFYVGLYNLNNRVMPPEEARYDIVARYVTDYARKHKITLEN